MMRNVINSLQAVSKGRNLGPVLAKLKAYKDQRKRWKAMFEKCGKRLDPESESTSWAFDKW